jgi:RNA polymerase sigma-70 factor, ECF subfamily
MTPMPDAGFASFYASSYRRLLDLHDALRALPLGQRQVIVLHHLVGLPVDEVARELRLAPGTVKSRLARGRAAMASTLQPDGSEVTS